MRKSLYWLFLLALPASFDVSAEVNGVQISDGEESVVFYLADRPEVTFTDSDLIVSAGERKVLYPLTSTVTFDFVEDSAVEGVDAEAASFSFSASEIRATGLKANEPVMFFTMSGKLVCSVSADAAGELRMATDILPKEPLIVKTNKFAYKFLSF